MHHVKRTLWDYIGDKLEQDHVKHGEKNDLSDNEAKQDDSPLAPAPSQKLYMSDMLVDMFESGAIDEEIVSINSAFVCLLHLGNE